MANQRHTNKRLYGGYLLKEEIKVLDEEAERRGFENRTDFLRWLASIASKLPSVG